MEAFCIYVRNRNGNLNVPYLFENDDKVVLNWNWLDNDFNADNPALRHATRIISLLLLREGFVLRATRSNHQDSGLSYFGAIYAYLKNARFELVFTS